MKGIHHHAWFLCSHFIYCMWLKSSHLPWRARIPSTIAASSCVCHESSRDVNPGPRHQRKDWISFQPCDWQHSKVTVRGSEVSEHAVKMWHLPRGCWRDGLVVKSPLAALPGNLGLIPNTIWLLVPSPVQHLTAVCNSRSMGSCALFWALWAPGIRAVYRHTWRNNIRTYKNKQTNN